LKNAQLEKERFDSEWQTIRVDEKKSRLSCVEVEEASVRKGREIDAAQHTCTANEEAKNRLQVQLNNLKEKRERLEKEVKEEEKKLEDFKNELQKNDKKRRNCQNQCNKLRLNIGSVEEAGGMTKEEEEEENASDGMQIDRSGEEIRNFLKNLSPDRMREYISLHEQVEKEAYQEREEIERLRKVVEDEKMALKKEESAEKEYALKQEHESRRLTEFQDKLKLSKGKEEECRKKQSEILSEKEKLENEIKKLKFNLFIYIYIYIY
jgi:chromosome segregation ATPase